MTKMSSAKVTAVPAGPGKTLCDARIQKRLSREQVAEMLHLSPQQIIALENDDFENLPGPTYVRGYLRSYAQAVGLSAEEVIAAYASVNGMQRSITLNRLAPEPEVTTRDGLVKFATVSVAGILIVLAIVWWQGRGVPVSGPAAGESTLTANGSSSSSAAVARSPHVASGAQRGTRVPGGPAQQALDEQAGRHRRAGGEPYTGAAAPAAGNQLLSPADPVKDDAIEAAPSALQGSTQYERATANTPFVDDALLGQRIAAQQSSTGGTQLVVYTREASWVDIRDARQYKLLYGVLPAGRTVTVVGTPPFNVFLGNPDSVELEYKGEYIAASQYKRGVVARFTVGIATAGTEQ